MILRILPVFFIFLLFSGCVKQHTKPVFVASNPPISSIIKSIAGEKAEVINLLSPGESPHTFTPGTETMKSVEKSLAVFYVSPSIDGWVADIAPTKKICLLDFVEKAYLLYFDEVREKKIIDPHFWTDPIIIKSIVPKICQKMSDINPENEKYYKANAEIFLKKLDMLDKNLEEITTGIKGSKVVLFHPSFRYFIKRYGMDYLASVETSPGKEPTPKYITELIEKIKNFGVKAVFSETELPEASAKALAEAANVPVFQLDPLGGTKGRTDYAENLIFNAKIFKNALK